MSIKKRHLLFIILSLTTSLVFAELTNLTGTLVNGRGGVEKCDNVKIKVYVDSRAKALLYTNEYGVFSKGETGTANTPNDIVEDFTLDANYPNPFNKDTSVPFKINNPGEINLSIYDIRGKKVHSLVQDHFSAGEYSVIWNGLNNELQLCPQGIYFSVLQMNGKTEIKKMTLSSSSLMSSGSPATMYLAKATNSTLELKIEDSDIENTTYTQTYSEIPTTLDLGTIPVHVYPYLRTAPTDLSVLEGENVSDTIDIYFEKDIEITSNNIDFDWSIHDDSTIIMNYKNVKSTSADFSVKEVSDTKTNTFKINFDLDLSAKIWPKKLRRIYVGETHAKNIVIENSKGNVQVSPTDALPASFSFNGLSLEGNAQDTFTTLVHMNITDDRNVTWQDSAYLVAARYEDLTFNDYVVDLLEEYHRDGRYPYSWTSGYTGVTRNLYYKDYKVASAKADSSHSTYCCGVTYEIWLRAMQRLQADRGLTEDINTMSTSNMMDFRSKWFVIQDDHRGPSLALEAYGVGKEIHDMKDVQKGDFVQIWRTGGTGHSVIFINWTTNAAGDTTGMRYWSTQTSTNGVNYNTEYFPEGGGTIDKVHTHYSRGYKPEEFE